MADIVIQLAPHILAALLYGALGFHFWNSRWREGDNRSITTPMQTWERSTIAAALLLMIVIGALNSLVFTVIGSQKSQDE